MRIFWRQAFASPCRVLNRESSRFAAVTSPFQVNSPVCSATATMRCLAQQGRRRRGGGVRVEGGGKAGGRGAGLVSLREFLATAMIPYFHGEFGRLRPAWYRLDQVRVASGCHKLRMVDARCVQDQESFSSTIFGWVTVGSPPNNHVLTELGFRQQRPLTTARKSALDDKQEYTSKYASTQ